MQHSTIWVHTQLPLVTRKKKIFNLKPLTPKCNGRWVINFSLLLTMGLIKWVSKHSWRPLPLEWTFPWDATPPENMPWMQVECSNKLLRYDTKHLQVLTSIVQRVATDFALKCSEEYRVIELEQASQGYQNKSITNMSLNHLSKVGRHKLTRSYSSAWAEQGAYTCKSKANLASFQQLSEF